MYERHHRDSSRSLFGYQLGNSAISRGRERDSELPGACSAVAPFRFMDLSVEIRQMIYREVLEGETDTTVAPLLLVSRGISAEVADTNIVPHIFIEVDSSGTSTIALSVRGTRHVLANSSICLSDLLRRTELLHQYKSLVVKYEVVPLEVHRKVGVARRTNPAEGMERATSALSSIMTFGSLESVTIVNHSNGSLALTDDDLRQIFGQLAILKPDVKISFELVHDTIITGFKELSRPRASPLSAFMQMKRDVPELVKQLKAANEKSIGAVFIERNWKAMLSRPQSWSRKCEEDVDRMTKRLRAYMDSVASRELGSGKHEGSGGP